MLHALPHEIMTIGGGAVGALLIGNTPSTLKVLGGAMKQVFSGPRWKEQVKAYIEDTQIKIGSVLCDLTVKMNAWVIRFPNPKSGGPGAKSEFIMTDMRQGLEEIVAVARGQAWTPPEETGVPAT